ncbi:hypothetical protein BGZ65_005537 [Modicella reniformis]|uniref:Large ribosomal subunit protein uL2m n=1 Tax=Modicella reniformis TaxID=1440133 RepID=A0A9P6IJS5_9FUNG|nr:hypothetical protein BGZ65_005537 [Modicella reniformis]
MSSTVLSRLSVRNNLLAFKTPGVATRSYATVTNTVTATTTIINSSATPQFKTYTPSSPGRRWLKRVPRDHLWKGKPIRVLTIAKRSTAGRNNTGRITVRHRGGGHKRRLRIMDWYRCEPGAQIVERLEYDPGRTAWIALVRHQESGRLSYILAPHDLQPGSIIYSFLNKSTWKQAKNGITTTLPIDKGNCLPLSRIPTGTIIHAIGMKRNGPAQIARSAGTGVAQNACDHPHGGGKGKTKGTQISY